MYRYIGQAMKKIILISSAILLLTGCETMTTADVPATYDGDEDRFECARLYIYDWARYRVECMVL